MKILYSLKKALDILEQGGLLLYPTETFYALGASAFIPSAIEKIYEVKERDISQPLPLIVKDYKQMYAIAKIDSEIAPSIEEIVSTFWPASLSIRVKAQDFINPVITASTQTIVVRQSPCSITQALASKLNAPLISTSANKSGEKPTPFFYEVNKKLKADALLIAKKQEKKEKNPLPSTIIEVLPQKKIRLLRQGAFNLRLLQNLDYEILFSC